MNSDEWVPIAQRIHAAFPSFASDAQTYQVYLDVLGDVDARAVSRAVEALLREGDPAPPPPGVIRSRALGLTPPSKPPAVAEARDHGARRGLGWVGILAAGGLALAAVAVVLALVNENDGGGATTAPGVTVTREAPSVTVERPTVTVAPPETSPPGAGGETTP